jgi:hypothetical protein
MNGSQQAIAGAGAVLHAARAERDELAAMGGAEAVARWAAPGLSKAGRAEAAQYWEHLQAQAQDGSTAA